MSEATTDVRFYSISELKKRGWTNSAIKRLLPEPDHQKPQRRYNKAGVSRRFWSRDRVHRIEKTVKFRGWKEGTTTGNKAFAHARALGAEDLVLSRQRRLDDAEDGAPPDRVVANSIDRWDPQEAQRIFARLYPDHAMLRAAITRLADSVAVAHREGPGAWSITLFEDMIRLNVGSVEVCTLDQGRIKLVTCIPESTPKTRGLTFARAEGPAYRSVPVDSAHLYIDAPVSDSILHEYVDAHHAYVKEAAHRKRRSSFAKAFSVGVLLFLEAELRLKLPRPRYFEKLDVSTDKPPRKEARPFRKYRFVGKLTRPDSRKPFEIDPDKVDQGNQAHANTQDALAVFLQELGIEPTSPNGQPDFDLGWEKDGNFYVAEVKSITSENEERQLRLGLGQVLRYRQTLLAGIRRNVVAVLVPEREPSDKSWLALCCELNVLITWPPFARLSFDIVR